MQTIDPQARTALVLAVATSLLVTLLCSPQSLKLKDGSERATGAAAFARASQSANFSAAKSLQDTD
jgi:hypothetical protein